MRQGENACQTEGGKWERMIVPWLGCRSLNRLWRAARGHPWSPRVRCVLQGCSAGVCGVHAEFLMTAWRF
jgi:hypothetical protein